MMDLFLHYLNFSHSIIFNLNHQHSFYALRTKLLNFCLILQIQEDLIIVRFIIFPFTMSKYLIGCLISATIATTYTFAVGHDSRLFAGIPVMYLVVLGIHLMQIVAFIPAKIFNTQMFYDLTGSLTYIAAILFCLLTSDNLTTKQTIAAGLVLFWTIRLGGFLFYRIIRSGIDSRFVKIKQETLRFFMAWFIQGLWVALTAGPVYSFLTEKYPTKGDNDLIGILEIVGLLLWASGFIIESIADFQKTLFNANKANKDKFIQSGLWRYSRHPNYCGEITLWVGVALFTVRSLEGWQYLSLISPVFVYFLLTKVSGVPLLEAKANKKWGGQAQYEKYKSTTPVMFPWSSQKQAQQKTKKG